jgi:hypothetical protein
MENRIRNVQITQRRWDASVAELRITVEPETMTPTTEVRGRLEGPRCPGVTTLEVAYILRPLPGPRKSESGIAMRVVIPDPVAWEEASPYVYEGSVELWQDGRKCDERPIRMVGKSSACLS